MSVCAHLLCVSKLSACVQMTKKIKKLEKETTQWRTKWESNNQALLQMAEEVTVLFVFGCFDVVAQKNQ